MNNQKDRVIDSHVHIDGFWNDKGELFLNGFDEYIRLSGIETLNIASLPSGLKRDVSCNIACAFYKLVNKNAFAHGGLTYTEYPAPNPAPEGMDPLTQYNELMEIGFDGIKMLEGKPNFHKLISIPFDNEYYEGFFNAIEKDGTHILFHVNDPEEFWDPAHATEELRRLGWFYGDGDYDSNEEVYRQVYAVLEKHPNLCATFAHFFFYSKSPEKLEALFAKYPNVAVDLTPGGEMYCAFGDKWEYYKEFFKRNSERLMLGTDSIFPGRSEGMFWLYDRVYRYLATSDTVKGFADRFLTGINLEKKYKDNILYSNFVRRVSEKPKEINKEALKKYIEKYKGLIRNPKVVEEIERLSKELL